MLSPAHLPHDLVRPDAQRNHECELARPLRHGLAIVPRFLVKAHPKREPDRAKPSRDVVVGSTSCNSLGLEPITPAAPSKEQGDFLDGASTSP